MKTLVLVVLVAIASREISADSAHNQLRAFDLISDLAARGIAERFKSLLEDFRHIMRSGNSTLGLPVLDPLDVVHQKLNVNEEKLKIRGEVNDLHVDGLSDYVVNHADFKISKWNVSVDASWTNIKGKTDYDVNGYAMDKVRIYGTGDISFDIKGFHFGTQAKLKINYLDRKVSIVNFNATVISLEDIQMKITGLYNNEELSELVSAVISDVAVETIRDFQEEITTEVNKIMLKQGNQILDQYTLDDILGLIG